MTKQEPQNKRVAALVAILAILILAVVTFYSSTKELTEKEKFILANTEITCEVLKDPSLTINLEKSKNLSKEIFKKYEFPVEDNDAMLLLLDKYETDPEVLESVQAKLEEECVIE
jgi:hypothetical protein